MNPSFLVVIAACTGFLGCQDAPGPAPIPMPVEGSTYEMQLETATWAIPANGADLLTASGIGGSGLIGIQSAQNGELVLMLALATEGNQDSCSRTMSVSGSTVNAERTMNYGPAALTLANGTVIEDAHLRGTFSEDFSSLKNLRFTGRLDLDTFDTDLLPEILAEEKDNLCEVIATVMNIPCEPCADGRIKCVSTDVVQSASPLRVGVTLQTIEEADCHATCQANAEDCTLD